MSGDGRKSRKPDSKRVVHVFDRMLSEVESRAPEASAGAGGRLCLKSLAGQSKEAIPPQNQKNRPALVREHAEKTGFASWTFEYCKWLSANPDIESALRGRAAWEQELEVSWWLLVQAKKKNPLALKWAAQDIGRIVAEQVETGEYATPRSFANHLIRHPLGKGKGNANKNELVAMAFYTLLSEGKSSPSRAEVRSLLAE